MPAAEEQLLLALGRNQRGFLGGLGQHAAARGQRPRHLAAENRLAGSSKGEMQATMRTFLECVSYRPAGY
jgi:hypothetical protein